MTDSIDYRDLLVRYICHVSFEEGTSFIGISSDYSDYFNEEQKLVLRELDNQSLQYQKANHG